MLHQLNCKTFSDDFVHNGIQYLRYGTYPLHIRYDSERHRWADKYKGFNVVQNTLFFKKLRVVPDSQRDSILRGHYELFGDIGRDRFYNFLKRSYLGISRRQTNTFLANQELHQLSLPVRKQKVSKPILTNQSMERWQADLIDMKAYKSPQNRQTTFVFTVIDCFSKKAWAVPLTRKTGGQVAQAITQLFVEHGAPRIVQTDVGSEFMQEFDRALDKYNVHHIRSTPYTPQTNGQIERFNGTIKRIIHAHMKRHSTRIYIGVLGRLLASYNSIPHTATQRTPDELHSASRVQQQMVALKVEKKAAKTVKKNQRTYTPIHVGNHVRVARTINPTATPKPSTFWEEDITVVDDIIKSSKPWLGPIYLLANGRSLMRDKLQPVDVSNLVRIPKKKPSLSSPPTQLQLRSHREKKLVSL